MLKEVIEWRCELCSLEILGFSISPSRCKSCNKMVCCTHILNGKCARCSGTDCLNMKIMHVIIGTFAFMLFMLLIF